MVGERTYLEIGHFIKNLLVYFYGDWSSTGPCALQLKSILIKETRAE